MIHLSSGDEIRISVDADDRVANVGKEPTHAPGPTAGIEYASTPRHHRIDEPRFTSQIIACCCHGPETFDVPP